MPSIIAHSIHGEKVKEKLNAGNLDAAAFAWGVQGPDFFYFHRLMPRMKGESLKALNGQFHEVSEAVLRSMKAAAGSDEVKRSYVKGLCCHFALDSATDPYIRWLTGRLAEERGGENPEDLMNEIGSALDTVLLRHEQGKLANEVKLSDCLPENVSLQKTVAELYCRAAKEVLGRELPEEAVFQATEDAVRASAALTDKTTLKKALLGKFEHKKSPKLSRLIRPMLEDNSYDYANINKALWKDNEGRERDTDFFELVDCAVQKALETVPFLFHVK